MPAIFYLSLPPVEVAAATNRLAQPEQSRAVEPHPFDEVIDRVTSSHGTPSAGRAGAERGSA